MKKTISINIGGIIFHIEEDGYEKLKGYLSSIQKYFSSFADSKEIVSDIEGRIAERFTNKQKAEAKQVISLTDVDELIAAMGTVADFEAIEQAQDILADPLETATSQTFVPKDEPVSGYTPPITEPAKAGAPKKLYRDLRRKLLGGVAAGLAHYFTVDPIWVRLAFLFTVVGLPAGSGMLGLNMEDEFGPFSGFMVLVYIAMWVAFPGTVGLEEDTKIKKFYRDPDRKVVGGVAAGVASYFGVDLGVVRFLWVLSILLFGTGVLIYIVLWIIAPVAHTLTEKMEMQGEPITLSNIESNIKQSLNLEERGGEEHGLTKVLLFPFRAIALIIGALGKLLRGLGPILRILIGAMLIAMSVLSLLALVIAGGVALGLTNAAQFDGLPAPLLIFQELPDILVLSGILVAAVPLITFLLLGLTLLSNKRIVGSSVWLTMLGLWIVGIIGSTVGGVSYQRNFAKRGEVVQSAFYAVPVGTLTLDYDNNYDHNEDNVDISIRIEGYNNADSVKLEKTLSARGRNREDAEKNAEMLKYDIAFKDSTLLIKEGPVLASHGPFRDQRIELALSVPYNKTFIMTRDFYYSLSHWDGSYPNMGKYHLDNNEVKWNTLKWEIRSDSGLVCINMPAKFLKSPDEENNSEKEGFTFDYDDNSGLELGEKGNYIKQFTVTEFNKIDIGGAYSIVIQQGAEFNVAADAEEQEAIDDIKVFVENGTLKVKRSEEFNLFNNDWKRVGLVITMPTIEGLSLSGANKTLLTGFIGLAKLNVDISGASKTELNVDVDQLSVGISGASKATLKGSAKSANLDAHGACKLDATEMNIQTADVEASGVSKMELGRIPNLDRHASGASKINVQQ
ncbi:PspC domain-containing protein [Dyadobacter arcticus]|uniref:Phage shock protein PspC (Stress-responsive transcriptional regulator) n=1 Tax=Dyadobacter arcticus TaxID=1078754 RepID=A0ABX0UUA8_9BACT|nr:PspC domain-containing protein [Dyadobacter arcticus]NIJ55380.1 phage shock protein PspC (stress-responsive transcriptional regulator) [Dyadobacter arcticus]